ncbi:tRNA (adenosine(37)-N6)-threonylcarbamoyltransferase complex ATPase subunit type 1 TsaE [Parafilimonas sp.]|uniref:tRNA (adenosine(37)-N6)-threonylcarbamoyltransferase complex ATPase subunit type 1 TsaE n=1 Tax=Parafilimonas sp. TaxID=1969739 RepID=UPI0039E5F32E
MKELTYNISEIKTVARQLWHAFSSKKIWAFYAEMGSGKTTLIHALCDVLQVKDAVSSPTFAIINEYTSPVAGAIYHIDGYRIKDETEAVQAGCEDCIESGNYCFVEWPEKFPGLLPEESLHIALNFIDNNTRKLVIE